MSGQSIVDRLNAAKHVVAGSALGRAVIKATTEEVMAPKRKHLDCMLSLKETNNCNYTTLNNLSQNKRLATSHIRNQRVHTANGRLAH
jgi:hypothetical protein